MKSGKEGLKKKWISGCLYQLTIFGLFIVLNHLFWEFLSHYVAPNHGNSVGSQLWWNSVKPCKKCSKMVNWEQGIFCTNSGHNRGGFADCEGVWCGSCFTPHPLDPATVAQPLDFNGEPLLVEEDQARFSSARNGDHTLTPFQCPLCHCRNIKRRDLRDSWADELFQCQVIRATIDSFWARTPGTLDGHLSEIRFQLRYGKALGISNLPRLGPWPLGDHQGMLEAITLECRAMEKGTRGRQTVTYSTVRKARTVYTNLWTASPASGADICFSSTKQRYFATRCPSQSQWFEHFTKGLRIRTGVLTRQDRAYTMDVVHEVLRMFENEWEELDGDPPLLWISAVTFFLASCLGGMRGFEVVWTDLAALIHDMRRLEEDDDDSGIGWPIVGRFKAEGGGVGGHVIPIAGVTSSGIEFYKWVQRFVHCLKRANRTEGWAFARPDGSRAKASDYRNLIFDKLVIIQETMPSLIDPILDVYDSYGIQRSGRRFFDTECKLRGVKKEDIEDQCRWIRDRTARGVPVPRDMVDCYTEYRHMRQALLRCSRAL
jgi:hypothetical protein